MTNVIPILRCGKCGNAGTPITVSAGQEVINIVACDKCMSEIVTFLDRVRPIFDAMIACGVDRDLANESMTFLLDRMDP